MSFCTPIVLLGGNAYIWIQMQTNRVVVITGGQMALGPHWLIASLRMATTVFGIHIAIKKGERGRVNNVDGGKSKALVGRWAPTYRENRRKGKMKVLAIGGTGKVGSEVVKELRKREIEVRVLARKKDELPQMPEGVELVEGDLLDPVSVDKALDGVEKLYLLNAVVPDELTHGLIAYDLAKKRKLQHIVYHSVFRVDRFKDVPHFASKLAIESALREFDLPFTIIRPNYFFQNDETMKDPLTKAGIYPVPLGSTGISAVDIRDIAEAAAITLTSSGHQGKTYNLNGPEVLSGSHVAQIWSGILQKEIRYTGEDMDGFEQQMRQKAPSWSAFDIRMMFQGYLERGFQAEAGDIETLTNLLGHPPRRYQNFAQETAQAWEKQK